MSHVTIKPVNTVLNTIDVVIEGETHTAASCIVERLTSDPECEYAAYKVDHPMDEFVTIRVKGNESRSAKDVLRNSIISIIKDVDDVIGRVKQSRP